MNRIRACRHQRGVTLIELMISLLISTLILAGLIQIFSMNRSTYQTDEGLARLQENARFSLEFLTREIRNAGSYGCFGLPRPSGSQGQQKRSDKVANYVAGPTTYVYNKDVPDIFDITVPLRGFDSSVLSDGATYTLPTLYPPATTTASSPAIPASYRPNSFVVGSDVLVVRGMDQDSVPLSTPLTDPDQVNVVSPNNFNNGQVVVAVSDCDRAFVFQVTGILPNTGFDSLLHDTSGNPGNVCSTWSGANRQCPGPSTNPQGGGEVGILRNMVYYVGVGTSGGPALFRDNYVSGALVSEELVDGVENMQLHFGDGTRYFEAQNVIDWTTIRSVRVGLLVATSNVVTGQDLVAGYTAGATETDVDTNQYMMSNVTLLPSPDRRRRRTFETTIAVRNPL